MSLATHEVIISANFIDRNRMSIADAFMFLQQNAMTVPAIGPQRSGTAGAPLSILHSRRTKFNAGSQLGAAMDRACSLMKIVDARPRSRVA